MDEDRSHEALLVFGFARMRERFLRGARVRLAAKGLRRGRRRRV